ncbi:MAG: PRC-barrel domain-containing protein [Caldilineaceae bacterium]|nr:PRC-barrel domain-containing protein [Caldilineaceae bacterium]
MKKVLGLCLFLPLLVLAACEGMGTGNVPPEATATAAVATVAATPTEELSATTEVTGTEGLTETEGMTGTDEITETEGMTGTGGLTETGGVSGASVITGTEMMTGTATMTETAGVEAAPRHLIRAADLQGYNVQNPAGESLGSVQDLVINLDTGQILLVTLEYGGFLDIGDKVFPIPLSAFRFEQETADVPLIDPALPGAVVTDTTIVTDTTTMTGVVDDALVIDTLLILDIPEETFQNAPGFADNFPVLTDPASIGDIERFYRELGEDVIGHPIAETNLDELSGRVVKLSDLEGGNVENPAGEGIGEITDMLIDLRAGRVEYLILSFGGFLGIGQNRYAVPVDAFVVIPTSADVEEGWPELVLDITEEQLQTAPIFDDTTLGLPDWDRDSRQYWLPQTN